MVQTHAHTLIKTSTFCQDFCFKNIFYVQKKKKKVCLKFEEQERACRKPWLDAWWRCVCVCVCLLYKYNKKNKVYVDWVDGKKKQVRETGRL